MECLMCNVTDANVAVVATCSNRCAGTTAHPECFQRRQTFSQWRKKHHDRRNTDSEVCLVVGCQGKCKVKPSVRNARALETNDDLRREIQEMEYASHCEALRITRLELKIQNEREELDMERALLLRSAVEEDKRIITSLKEEVEHLRAESVTLKRREESIKAKCMTSRDTQKKEIVRTIQEFLASM